MTEHPLTDQIIQEELITKDECDRREGDGRGNYYKEDFRAGADWQLKQVMKWLDINITIYTDNDYLGDCLLFYMLESDLIEAMRPTQEDNS